MKSFEELGVSPEILRAIEEMGYEQPMPVQEEVIPYLLGDGNDVVALAQTGTGKTAAFGLPLLQKIEVERREPQALILCPTRELCLQITGDLNDYSKYIEHLHVLPVYGGSSIEMQIRGLRKGVHIIVATPGRLIDLMERGAVSLSTIRDVVMDEADEMLNMGFTESINTILADVPKDRNTLLFSATMSPEIARISKNYLNNAKEIVIGTKNEGSKNVNHVYYLVHAKDKYLALKRIADYYPKIYAIIFCRTRLETQEIADKLIQDGYNADSLHGELSQQQRDLTMQKFRQRRIQLLVATDVAARGLDVDDLTHVINYGLPDDIESYTHRSGRTGRAGKTGTSIAIIHLREKGKMRNIERIIGKQFIKGDIPTGKQICEKQLYKVVDDIERVEVNEEEINVFLPEVYRKLEWLDKEDLIKRIISREFNRFLEYYSKTPEIEIPTEKGKQEKKENGRGKQGRQAEEGYTRLFINLGKTDNFYAAQLIELVNKHVHGKPQIGRIDLMKNFSFMEVAEEDARNVMKVLNRVKVEGRKVVVEIAGEEESPKNEKRKETTHSKKQEKKDNQHERTTKQNKRKSAYDEWDEPYAKKSKKRMSAEEPGKKKPSREERGYTAPRGPKRKDDWKQFFQHNDRPLKGEEPDFSEEGWARRRPKK
ncbi:MAG: DEAD/DEAH box helicase [Bacteroidaceae bacterium]|nr:DEAD/DEAH box helicase [Bacteroidaceae bacterium]